MYLVTGAAGFIGSQIVKGINDRGSSEILAVDNLSNGAKVGNLRDCVIADYMDKQDLARALEAGALDGNFRAILHQGACSDTMNYDGRYMMENNYRFSKLLLDFALAHGIPMVYASSASVYGTRTESAEKPENERPLHVYGYSKLAFDQHLRHRMQHSLESTVVGLRYFNVYGPRETQKGRMASMVYQLYRQLRETGVARLFEGSHGFEDGEQRRDFVYVGDVVDVNLALAEGPLRTGVYNLGTGRARSFNEVARVLIERLGEGRIEYRPFPEGLREKYQAFTEADLTALRGAGIDHAFQDIESGIAECVAYWDAEGGAQGEGGSGSSS